MLGRRDDLTTEFYTAVFGYRVEEFCGATRDDRYADARYAALYADDKPVAGAGEFHLGQLRARRERRTTVPVTTQV